MPSIVSDLRLAVKILIEDGWDELAQRISDRSEAYVQDELVRAWQAGYKEGKKDA